jgi:exosortase A-associated hydrolase 2
MNKTRHGVACGIDAFAEAGFATLQVDLLGCGDSPGELADVKWSDWQVDAQLALRWLQQQHPGIPTIGWGLRAGALLASELPTTAQLWWQPSLNGKNVLQQFLRLRLAATMASGPRTSMQALKAELEQTGTLEVSGYCLNASLARELETQLLQGRGLPTLWVEAQTQVQAQTPPSLLPASQQWLAGQSNPALQALAVHAPQAWAATEIESCEAITAASLEWLNTHWPPAS